MAESVDEEVFKRSLFAFRGNRGAQKAESAPHGTGNTEIGDCGRRDGDWIVEKAPEKVDATFPLASEHHEVAGLGRRFEGHLLKPPTHDAITL